MYEFLRDYTGIVNAMLSDIWHHIVWRRKHARGKKQERLLPTIPDYSFKKGMRSAYLQDWNYSKHWIDSAIKTAFPIIKSWKKNYVKGKRTHRQPVVKRLFDLVKQTLMKLKLEDNALRISLKPREFVYIDFPGGISNLTGYLVSLSSPQRTFIFPYTIRSDLHPKTRSRSAGTPTSILWTAFPRNWAGSKSS